jgi:hypothetical protein
MQARTLAVAAFQSWCYVTQEQHNGNHAQGVTRPARRLYRHAGADGVHHRTQFRRRSRANQERVQRRRRARPTRSRLVPAGHCAREQIGAFVPGDRDFLLARCQVRSSTPLTQVGRASPSTSTAFRRRRASGWTGSITQLADIWLGHSQPMRRAATSVPPKRSGSGKCGRSPSSSSVPMDPACQESGSPADANGNPPGLTARDVRGMGKRATPPTPEVARSRLWRASSGIHLGPSARACSQQCSQGPGRRRTRTHRHRRREQGVGFPASDTPPTCKRQVSRTRYLPDEAANQGEQRSLSDKSIPRLTCE